MIEIAIIGPTASGKSDTALKLANKYGAYILSLDSLALYKEVDIASAKPSKDELKSVRHFGIDILYPNEAFNAAMFMDEYEKAKYAALKDGKHLIIVGGSSFYLKSMMEGLSDMPPIGTEARGRARELVNSDIDEAYRVLAKIDPEFALGIKSADSYRISRGLEMFFEFGKSASELFASLPKKKVADGLVIYEITVDRDELREKIKLRTAKMFEAGLLDEAVYLSGRYGKDTKPMGSIGLKEAMQYIDGQIDRAECEELLNIHTWQLAKRQNTFNKSQLYAEFRGGKESVQKEIEKLF
jgi:tRNA dimethylallyltransferase